ncbi:aldo/keto reductase [Mesorhizobium sp. L-8-3]|uniref:aldo/keto reductase n=1 Tax=Mesorhizobium sp. L-8-3 TaxID=2744522 RepID=UPI001927EE45|nr:aldo/keto reductase [Mesorhizobium sp. L-8-3]BCH20894.1 aldo/keto reductase [Mesorhizobium sp. L-8-3]
MVNLMPVRPMGGSRIDASAIGLGTWAMGGWMWGGTDEAEAVAAIRASIDQGVSLIDTAPAYGLGKSEELVGEAISGRRDQVVLATKCGLVWHTDKGNHFFDEHGQRVHRYLGRESIFFEVEQSLKRLRTDYIDLYITHWQDPTTSVAETMDALLELKRQGKIRAIGVSNVSPDELEAYVAVGPVDAIQERYSMLDREIEATLLPICRRQGIATLSYSSLALGLLSGRIGPGRVFAGDDQRKDDPRFAPENLKRVAAFIAAIEPLAAARQATPAQVVIAWTIAQPGITYALCGARNPGQATENARAGTLSLSDSELAGIDHAIAAHLAGIGA